MLFLSVHLTQIPLCVLLLTQCFMEFLELVCTQYNLNIIWRADQALGRGWSLLTQYIIFIHDSGPSFNRVQIILQSTNFLILWIRMCSVLQNMPSGFHVMQSRISACICKETRHNCVNRNPQNLQNILLFLGACRPSCTYIVISSKIRGHVR